MLSPTSLLNAFLIHFTYLALIVLLVIAGTGVPLPEDIPLITAGYLCNKQESPIAKANLLDENHDGVPDYPHRHVPHISLMIAAGMIGVLLGDSVVFSLGRRGLDADNIVARHLRKVMHSKRREQVAKHFVTHGNLTVFAGRFLPGFRGIIFAFAGMSRMSYARFLALDGLAAAISVPVFILLGHHFADRINDILHFIDHVKHIVLPMIAVLIVGGIVLVMLRKRRAAVVP